MVPCKAQSKKEKIFKFFGERIFSPSLEVGFIDYKTSELSSSIVFKSSVEFRFHNNSDFFLRANYDTYNSKYTIDNAGNFGNILKGTAFFSDVLLGVGYRHGTNNHRFFGLLQPGIKFFDYPTATQNQQVIEVNQTRRRIFNGRLSLGYEYYINEKSALTLEVFHGNTFQNTYFWRQSGASNGLSIGFVTALL
jgi:hypothetical protein